MKHRTILLTTALMLSGCGANTLRLESAGAVSTSSTAVVDASRAALAELRLRRARANAVIVASDPSCSGALVIHIRIGSKGALCADGPGPEGTTTPLDTRPIADASVQPTLVMIAALADYATALDKTLGAPNRDIATELAALAAKAGEAQALAEALLGAGLPKIPTDLAGEQAQSAIKLAQFASNLAQEAGKVRRVRAIVAKHDAEVGAISAELQKQVRDWVAFAKTDAGVTTSRLRTVYNDQIRNNRPFEQRLAFVELLQSARVDENQVEARGKAMDKAVGLLGESRATLARHLKGDFTEAERRRIAAIEGKRIAEALRLLAQVATAVI